MQDRLLDQKIKHTQGECWFRVLIETCTRPSSRPASHSYRLFFALWKNKPIHNKNFCSSSYNRRSSPCKYIQWKHAIMVSSSSWTTESVPTCLHVLRQFSIHRKRFLLLPSCWGSNFILIAIPLWRSFLFFIYKLYNHHKLSAISWTPSKHSRSTHSTSFLQRWFLYH